MRAYAIHPRWRSEAEATLAARGEQALLLDDVECPHGEMHDAGDAEQWSDDTDQAMALAEVRRVLKAMRLPLMVRPYAWWCFEFSWDFGQPGRVRFDLSSLALHEFARYIENRLPRELPACVVWASLPRPRLSAGTHAYRGRRCS